MNVTGTKQQRNERGREAARAQRTNELVCARTGTAGAGRRPALPRHSGAVDRGRLIAIESELSS